MSPHRHISHILSLLLIVFRGARTAPECCVCGCVCRPIAVLRSRCVSRHGRCPALTAPLVAQRDTQPNTRPTTPSTPHTAPPLSYRRALSRLNSFTSISLGRSRLIHGSIRPVALPPTPSLIILQQNNAHRSFNPTDLPLSSNLDTWRASVARHARHDRDVAWAWCAACWHLLLPSPPPA
jgi:hypothetical protein